MSEVCAATGFMAWCQNTLVWYLINSENEAPRANHLAAVATGHVLGGTALSNPMVSFFGIEALKLKGTRVEGGYKVKGISALGLQPRPRPFLRLHLRRTAPRLSWRSSTAPSRPRR